MKYYQIRRKLIFSCFFIEEQKKIITKHKKISHHLDLCPIWQHQHLILIISEIAYDPVHHHHRLPVLIRPASLFLGIQLFCSTNPVNKQKINLKQTKNFVIQIYKNQYKKPTHICITPLVSIKITNKLIFIRTAKYQNK